MSIVTKKFMGDFMKFGEQIHADYKKFISPIQAPNIGTQLQRNKIKKD